MPDWSKIHTDLATRLHLSRANSATEYVPIIVGFHSEQTSFPRSVEAVTLSSLSFRLLPAVVGSATAKGVEQLSELDSVRMIWFDKPVHAMTDESIGVLGVRAAWESGMSGKGIRIGVIDSGIDASHPDLSGRIAQVKDMTGEGTEDTLGHGTMTAGIIVGSGRASHGKYRGVAPESTLYAAKVLKSDGWSTTSTVMAGIEWVVKQKVQIINVSVGTDESDDGSDALSAMCDVATAKGMIVCVPAGNSGPGQSTIGSPASARSVLAIGATDKEDQVAPFSSRGPTRDGRVKPDFGSPGVNVISCRAHGANMSATVNEYYASYSGTSAATAFVSGVCALLLEAEPALAPEEVRGILVDTAINLGVDASAQGAGRIDGMSAIRRLQPPSLPSPESSEDMKRRSGCLPLLGNLVRGR